MQFYALERDRSVTLEELTEQLKQTGDYVAMDCLRRCPAEWTWAHDQALVDYALVQNVTCTADDDSERAFAPAVLAESGEHTTLAAFSPTFLATRLRILKRLGL